MNKFESKQPKERIISSSKGKGSITFFNDHLVFKLKYDHTPRKIEYRDIDKIIDKKRTWFHIIYLVVVLVSAGAIICYFFYEAFGKYNLITFSLLLISTIVNFLEKGKLIQLKKGSLLVDAFSSNKSNEIQKVLKLLNHYVQGEKDR